MTNAIDLELVRTAGGTGLWPMIAFSNIAQGSAVFAYYFIKRHDEREAQISLPSTISAYLGVTEPALFGVNVKYVYPLVAGMSTSALSGLLSTVFGVQANSIGIGGLPAILSIKPQYWAIFAIIMVVDIVVAMVLTFLFHKTGFLTKTEEDGTYKKLQKVWYNQRLLLNQQRLLAHLLAKLNRLAKQQILSSHQVSWDKVS